MTTMRRFSMLSTLCFAVLCTGFAFGSVRAQTIDGRFTTRINEGVGTGGLDQFEVTLELQPSEAFELGTSTLMFTFNDDALNIPSGPAVNEQLQEGTDYEFIDPYIGDVGNGKFYTSSTVTVFGASNRLSVNIVLDIVDFGQTVPASFTPVVRLFFDIVDGAQSSMLSWVLAPDPNPTVVLKDDNMTALTNGAFTGEDVSLPVELVTFDARVDGRDVILTWMTSSEVNNAGFEVERSTGEGDFAAVGFVEGKGTTREAQTYVYRVTGLDIGRHVFRLKQVDFDGHYGYSPEVEAMLELKERYRVESPYPNPFNLQTTLRFAVREEQPVRVELYDVLGRRVAVLWNDVVEANKMQTLRIDGDRLASGLYFVLVKGMEFVTSRRILLVE